MCEIWYDMMKVVKKKKGHRSGSYEYKRTKEYSQSRGSENGRWMQLWDSIVRLTFLLKAWSTHLWALTQ